MGGLLGMEVPISRNKAWMDTFSAAETWELLGEAEHNDRVYAQAKPVADLREQHPWIVVCEQVAARQGFFHWELDFAPAFARGGFDLQVGNPPWVRPDVDIDALLAEGDPWWQLVSKAPESERDLRWDSTLERDGMRQLVLEGTAETVGTREFVSNSATYPLVDGLRPDLYRCFMEATWARESGRGVVALIHPESHFTDERAASLRSATYERLRRHWQFINEMKLFEIHHLVTFGVHIYGNPAEPHFRHATSLYLPETVERSMRHDCSGPEPGFKNSDGKWDTRAHASRIQLIDKTVLGVWRDVLESPATPPQQTRMLYTVNTAVADTLGALASAPRISVLDLEFSAGWNEKTDRQKGRFVSRWGPTQWKDAILQGPHLHVSTPLYKVPNATLRNNLDWASTDFEALPVDSLPVTAYKPAGDRISYDASYTHWDVDSEVFAARDFYRVAWRCMAANTGERTLIPALIPLGAAHVDGIFSATSLRSKVETVVVVGVLGSLLVDFGVRAAPKSTIRASAINRLPMVDLDHPLIGSLVLRTLRLNCVTDAYADLWGDCWDPAFAHDPAILPRFAEQPVGPVWDGGTPLRRAADRRNAQVEIDALVALMLGVGAEELCTVYRTQFAVLYGYDHRDYTFDVNGRLVPNEVLATWRSRGDALTVIDRTHKNPAGFVYTYELPFGTLDREADLRVAYAEWERRLAALASETTVAKANS